MKHTILATVALFLSTLSFADVCYENLSNNYQDSHVHRMNVYQYTNSNTLKGMSYTAMRILYKKHNCGSEKIYFKCGEAIKGIVNTEVCYGESKRGYFLVSRDYLDNLNIIFNRWD